MELAHIEIAAQLHGQVFLASKGDAMRAWYATQQWGASIALLDAECEMRHHPAECDARGCVQMVNRNDPQCRPAFPRGNADP